MLTIYNTLGRKKEGFRPMSDKKINAFFCGLTVYDDAHLGHAKAFINFDVIVRWLRHLSYEVTYAQNITDIDDKIIDRAKEAEADPIALARKYEARFMEDMQALGIKDNVDKFPRSHDYIDAVREQIQLLIDKGYAYLLGGDVYYDVAKFKDYTMLSGMKIEELERHRIEPKEGKKNVYDFALWKAAKPGEPSWKINVNVKGKETALDGRPGWHIEDTAMTYRLFGAQYDIHGGASELIFPHHTNEIAQAEAAFGKRPFVRYWMHVGVFTVGGVKMSKSLKNFTTIRGMLERHRPEALKLLFASTHYRKDVDYSEEAINEAEKRLGYLYAALSVFYNMKGGAGGDNKIDEIAAKLDTDFTEAMNDDFNTPLALSALTTTLNSLRAFAENNKEVGKNAKARAVAKILELGRTLGILNDEAYKRPVPKEVGALIREREKLRRDKKFKESDALRRELLDKYHIIVEDGADGPKWYRSA